jgi:hypothetical protein
MRRNVLPLALLLLLLLLCLLPFSAPVSAALIWRQCTGDFASKNASPASPVRFELQNVDMTPAQSNVPRGAEINISFAAKLTKGFVNKDATLEASVWKDGKSLGIDFRYNFCELILSKGGFCPITTGRVVRGNLRERVPRVVLRGAYVLRSVVYVNSKPTACFEVDLNVV